MKETSSSGSWILSGKVISVWMRSHVASENNDLSSSDDEFEDGTQIEPFSCDSRKVVIVSGSRVGSGASRGARPLPWLGCFACKHLTWIFRSLVSPGISVSPACRAQTGRGRAKSWAQSLFCPEQSLSQSGTLRQQAVARLCLARARRGSLSVSFSENFTRSVDWAGNCLDVSPGPSRVLRIRIRTGGRLSHRWPVILTQLWAPDLQSSICRPPLHTLGMDKSTNLTVTRHGLASIKQSRESGKWTWQELQCVFLKC